MWIKELNLDSYGCHIDKKIELKKGLNVIKEKNEWGKSTVFDSIISLYNGFDKSASKYLSWKTNIISFSAKLDFDGKDLIINRDNIAGKKNASIIFNDKKTAIKNKSIFEILELEKLDKELWSLTEDTNSIFNLIKSSSYKELIFNTVSDNIIDFNLIDEKILIDIKKIYTNTKNSVSKIYKLDREINLLEDKFLLLSEKKNEIERKYDILYQLNDEIKNLENEKNIIFDNLKKYRDIFEFLKIKDKKDKMEEYITKNNIYKKIEISDEIVELKNLDFEINNISDKIDEINNTIAKISNDIKILTDFIDEKIQILKNDREEYLKNLEKEKLDLIDNANKEYINREKIRKKSKNYMILNLIFAILFSILFLIFITPETFNIRFSDEILKFQSNNLKFIIFPILISIFIMICIKSKMKFDNNFYDLKKNIENIENMKKFNEFKEEFSIEKNFEINNYNEKLEKNENILNQQKSELTKLKLSFDELSKKREILCEKFFQEYATYEIEELLEIQKNAVNEVSKLKLIEDDYFSLKDRFSVYGYSYNEYNFGNIEDIIKNNENDIINIEDNIKNKILEVGKIDNIISQFNYGELNEVKNKILYLKDERKKMAIKYDMLLFTKEVIDTVKLKIIKETQPKFIEYINDNIKSIKNISIDNIVINNEKNIDIQNDSYNFDIEFANLSTSTKVVVILLLKLAILDEIDKKFNVPFIIDGSFDFLDEFRKKEIYRILEKIAINRQIIVFEH